MNAPLLTLDTASPTVSIAAGSPDGQISERQIDLRQSSEKLFHAIDEVLDDIGVPIHELEGIVNLRGPGSFTGLRVGMAAVLGFHQALDLPATALPTLPILASTVPATEGERVVAAVDAMRGDWSVQSFIAGQLENDGELGLRSVEELAELAPCSLVGFGVQALAEGLDGSEIRLVEAPPLAVHILRWIAHHRIDWDASLLTQPIYFRAPAVSLPKRRS